jgi:hypothetical protein
MTPDLLTFNLVARMLVAPAFLVIDTIYATVGQLYAAGVCPADAVDLHGLQQRLPFVKAPVDHRPRQAV